MIDEVGIVPVRVFMSTKQHLGIGRDGGAYFVYDRPFSAASFDWHQHCGPYSTFDEALAWIRDIREEPAK